VLLADCVPIPHVIEILRNSPLRSARERDFHDIDFGSPSMQMRMRLFTSILFLLVTTSAKIWAADHPWQVTSKDGKSFLAAGFFAQGQAEWLTNPKADNTAKNLFLRRLRLIAGGQISDKISFFIETDSPNLGKGQADGTKLAEKVFLQDVIFTYKFRNEFMLDGGMLLVPLSHNGGQGATTLLPVDYGPYSFLASDPTDSRAGRDYGLQARGYVFGQHLEYRFGVFQGRRGTSASAPFRYSGRVVWYPFEAETGFFYSGTNLGTKKILALGTTFDNQDNYHSQSVDCYYDQPLRRGDGLTMQADYTRYDGGTTFTQLPLQHAWLAEVGYYVRGVKLGPFMQFSGLRYSPDSGKDQSKYVGGLAWWPQGHRFNVKLGIGSMKTGSDPRRLQVAIQTQFYVY
jgi:hypothetical protein